jgi:hypothetical protein
MSSLADAKTAANSQLMKVVSLQQQYSLLQAPQSANMSQISSLDSQIQEQNDILKSLHIAEETYAQEYLDRKNSPSQGYGNIQHLAITMFYLTYIFIFVVIIYTLLSYSTQKMKLFGAVSVTGIILLIVITQMIINFG